MKISRERKVWARSVKYGKSRDILELGFNFPVLEREQRCPNVMACNTPHRKFGIHNTAIAIYQAISRLRFAYLQVVERQDKIEDEGELLCQSLRSLSRQLVSSYHGY